MDCELANKASLFFAIFLRMLFSVGLGVNVLRLPLLGSLWHCNNTDLRPAEQQTAKTSYFVKMPTLADEIIKNICHKNRTLMFAF